MLDTHIWLWSLGSPERVSPAVRFAIVNATEVVLSVASIWEVGIKHAMGKLPLNAGVRARVDEAVRELRARVLGRSPPPLRCPPVLGRSMNEDREFSEGRADGVA